MLKKVKPVTSGARLALIGGVFLGLGCTRSLTVPGLGRVPYSTICADKSCGVQGDAPPQLATDSDSARIVVASVSDFLGNTMDPTRIYRSPEVCQGPINLDTQAFSTPTMTRTVQLDEKQRKQLKANLTAGIGRILVNAGTAASGNLSAELDRVTEDAINSLQSFEVKTWTLKPDAFTTRKQICGAQTETARVLRSITLVRASVQSTDDLKTKLAASIKANATVASALAAASSDAGAAAGLDATISTVVEQIVKTEISGYQFGVAFGFDDAA